MKGKSVNSWCEHIAANSLYYSLVLWSIQLIAAIAVVYLSTHYFTHNPGVEKIVWWYQGFGRWDGEWYQSIAKNGYFSLQSTAFFPIYPLLIRAFHNVSGCSWLLSGWLISNLSFLFALIFLYKLVDNAYDTAMARKTLLFLVVFPSAMFFNVAYTEAITLLTTVLFFYFLSKDQWFSAMLAGFVATGVHDLGIVLAVPALMYLLKNRSQYPTKVFWLRLLSIGIIGLSLVFYMVFLYLNFGTFLGFVKAQSYWQRIPVIPVFNVFVNLAKLIFKHGCLYTFMKLINAFATLLFVYLGFAMFTKKKSILPANLRWFFVLTLLLSITSGAGGSLATWFDFIKSASLDSYARFMVVLFPGFIMLAHLIDKRKWFYGTALVAVILKFMMLGLFATGYVVI